MEKITKDTHRDHYRGKDTEWLVDLHCAGGLTPIALSALQEEIDTRQLSEEMVAPAPQGFLGHLIARE